MEKKTKFTLVYFLIAFMSILLLENYFFSREITTISYSEFKILLDERLINDLVIAQTTIEGRFVKGAQDRLIAIRRLKDEAAEKTVGINI